MELDKLKKRAKWISALCLAFAAGFFLLCVWELIRLPAGAAAGVSLVSTGLLCLLSLYIMVSAFGLMRSVWREESPFTPKSVNRLRGMGWALILYEAAQEISAQIVQRMIFSPLAEGASIRVVSTMGGLFYTVGLMLLGVAMIFRYGMELQRLSDETL